MRGAVCESVSSLANRFFANSISFTGHSASASSSSPSVLCRFDCGSASSAPPASTSSSASASPPSSSAPVLPPLTARFAAFSSDFCFSCSLYAAQANRGVSGSMYVATSRALGLPCEVDVLGPSAGVAVCVVSVKAAEK